MSRHDVLAPLQRAPSLSERVSQSSPSIAPVLMNLSQLFGLDYRSLALFRIALALVIIGDVLDRSHDLGAHYTDEGDAVSA